MKDKKINFSMLDEIISIAEITKGCRLEEDKIKPALKKINRLQKAIPLENIDLVLFCTIFKMNLDLEITIETQATGYFPNDLTAVSRILGLSKKELLRYKENFSKLNTKGYIVLLNRRTENAIFRFFFSEIAINEKVLDLILKNRIIEEKKYSEAEIRDLFTQKINNSRDIRIYNLAEKVLEWEASVPKCSFISEIHQKIRSSSERGFFYILCAAKEYFNYEVTTKEILSKYFENWKPAIQKLSGCKSLESKGLISIHKESLIDDIMVSVTDKGINLFFTDEASRFTKKRRNSDLINSDSILEKELFFSMDTGNQLERLSDSLDSKNFIELQKRLDSYNLGTGVCALFYGDPGTGKTESVLQIARKTGRNVMKVEISETKSCWFGESEKLIKRVFLDYENQMKEAMNNNEPCPILLFNEADAIISKRKSVESSNVAQTENAIQNIILENLETFKGIMFATTNLVENFDSAFERRFLFKIRFEKPETDMSVRIWKSKLKQLDDKQAYDLARTFTFSGGEIDNISRKMIMNEVITGKVSEFDEIKEICNQEKIKSETAARIGFCA